MLIVSILVCPFSSSIDCTLSLLLFLPLHFLKDRLCRENRTYPKASFNALAKVSYQLEDFDVLVEWTEIICRSHLLYRGSQMLLYTVGDWKIAKVWRLESHLKVCWYMNPCQKSSLREMKLLKDWRELQECLHLMNYGQILLTYELLGLNFSHFWSC